MLRFVNCFKRIYIHTSLEPGRASRGETNEVDRLHRDHQAAAALTGDEENSTSSSDSISASRSRISDVTASHDTANEKQTTLQRPEHRQVPPVIVFVGPNINFYSPTSGSKERNIQTYKYGEKAIKTEKNNQQV